MLGVIAAAVLETISTEIKISTIVPEKDPWIGSHLPFNTLA